MKPVPLHVVRYFKEDETRTLSKHLHADAALHVANRFVLNLRDKINAQTGGDCTVVVTQSQADNPSQTLFTLTSQHHEPGSEGVTVTLETHRDPHWDYPEH